MTAAGPFERPGLGRRAGAFVLAILLAFAAVPFSEGRNDLSDGLVAFAAFAALVGLTLALPWQRWPRWAQSAPPLAFFLVVGLLREAAGGASSGYAALVLLPVLWLALYGTRRQLLIAFAAMLVTFALPLLLVGAPDYPASDWRRIMVLVMVCVIAALAVQQLVRERAELTEEIARLARTDQLTGTPNRRAWDEALAEALARVARTGEPLTVAMLDLDNFKAYNDAFGHPAGDRLLKAVTASWHEGLRPGDVLARYGGEEFAVMLPGCDAEQATAVLERLRRAMPLAQTCSAGSATACPEETAEALLARADAALYLAKRAGRDRVVTAA